MNNAFIAAMNQALDRVSGDDVRALVLTARPRVRRGLDLVESHAFDERAGAAFVEAFDGLFARAFAFTKPVVAAINGHAVAGGCVLACAADWRVMAAGDFTIALTEVPLGIPFPVGALECARHAIPRESWGTCIWKAGGSRPSTRSSSGWSSGWSTRATCSRWRRPGPRAGRAAGGIVHAHQARPPRRGAGADPRAGRRVTRHLRAPLVRPRRHRQARGDGRRADREEGELTRCASAPAPRHGARLTPPARPSSSWLRDARRRGSRLPGPQRGRSHRGERRTGDRARLRSHQPRSAARHRRREFADPRSGVRGPGAARRRRRAQASLATSWETPDDRTYVFHLATGYGSRTAPRFRPRTSRPPSTRSRPRLRLPHRGALTRVQSIEVRDPRRWW